MKTKLFTLSLLATLILPAQSEAARIWSSGFESQSVSDGVEWTSTWDTYPTINTTVKRSGQASAYCDPGSGTDYGGIAKQVFVNAFSGSFYVRFYIRIAAFPTTNEYPAIFYANGTYGDTFTINLNGDDNTMLLYEVAGDTVLDSSAPLSTNTWYRVEFAYIDNGTNGSVEARIDGVPFASVVNDAGYGSLQMGSFAFACEGTGFLQAYFDDIAVNDTSGSSQNSWPGEGRIVHLYPNAAGDNNTWQKAGGAAGDGNNYQSVSEVTPDDASTYLQRTTTTIKVDDYNVTNTSTAGIDSYDTVSLVQVGVRASAFNDSLNAARYIYLRLKKTSGGTVSKSSSIDYSSLAWKTHRDALPSVHQLTAYLDPDGAAWTPSTLDSMQVGMENTTSSTVAMYITSLWALVEYVDVEPSTPAPTGPLYFSVGKFLVNGGKLIIN